MARPPPRTGTVAAIGAYLDLVPGKEVNPGIVTNWVNKFRDYVLTVCESSSISLIVTIIFFMTSMPTSIWMSSSDRMLYKNSFLTGASGCFTWYR
jgi:hypothetical protein